MTDDLWTRLGAQFRDQTPRWSSPAALALKVDPEWRLTPALKLIDDALVNVAEGRCKRLIVALSPQEGKTTLVAQAFLLWWLSFRPESRNVIASYEQEIAQRNGRRIRDLITTYDGRDGQLDLGLRVRRGDHAAARWTLDGHRGGVVCVGVGAALTGRAVDGVLVIDDPMKDQEQAFSAAYRERVWDWWRSTARTRLSPSAAVVVIATRWHAEDLTGKLLADDPTGWRVVSIPAIADSPDDPLGREVGEPMVSARGRTAQDWADTKREVGEYVWSSLYQQRPAPLAGGIFKRDKIKYWRPTSVYPGREFVDLGGQPIELASCWRFLVADLAASTKTRADFTVIVTFALTMDGLELIVLDVRRERMQPSGHLEAARPMFQRWNAHTLFIESTFHSATLTYEATKAGIPVQELKADTDKITRALPAAARVEQGRVWLPEGAPWVGDFLDEIAAFPNGAHDDQVDCLAYAARIAATHYTPPPTAEEERLRREAVDPADVLFDLRMDAAFGPSVNLFEVQW